MALSPKEMQEAIISNLRSKTGRDLAAWIALSQRGPHETKPALTAWLKEHHGLGHVTAQVIAAHVVGVGAPYAAEGELLASLFDASLRELYDEVEATMLAAAPDVERVVCKTYVSFRSRRQFAAVRAEGPGLLVAFALPDDSLNLARTRFRAGGRMTHELQVAESKDVGAVKKAARAAVGALS